MTASEDENADLFWGVRGGSGNFGVVTAFEYRLHPVGKVLGGMVLYEPTSEAVRFYYEFSAACPDEVSTAGLFTSAPDGTPVFAVLVCHCGSLEDAEQALAPLREFGPPIADMIEAKGYLELQQMTDEAWPPGNLYYWKSSLVRELGDELVDTLVDHAVRRPTPLSVIYLQQLHGAATKVPSDHTAFAHRFDHYNCGAMLQTQELADTDGGIRWARDCWEAIQPHAERRNYVNDLGGDEQSRVGESYGPNYTRLRELKRRYDPDNTFRLNANIEPAGA